MMSTNSRAQAVSDSLIIRGDRFQGMRARAYGPQYPQDKYPLMVLDAQIMFVDSINKQCLDSLMSGKLQESKENIARLFGLKKDEISSVTVLKDNAAIAEWGQRGANGVIEVTTKKGVFELEKKYADFNKYEWEAINDEIQKERSKTELNSLPGEGLYIPSDHSTYYSIEDLYNNWILK
jgi:TonB-dependent SusC/RagA subfamily outer membrane receptor